MNKLNNVEAQRVVVVLRESLEKVSLLAEIPPDPVDGIYGLLEREGMFELSEALRSQLQLEESLRVLQCDSIRSSNRNSHACVEMRKRVWTNTRLVVRLVMTNPRGLEIMREEYSEYLDNSAQGEESKAADSCSLPTRRCVNALSSLKDVMFKALGTTVEEDLSLYNLIQEKVTRAKEIDEDRSILQHQLAADRLEKEGSNADLDVILNKFTTQLSDIKQTVGEENAKIEGDALAESNAAKDKHEKAMVSLSTEQTQLRVGIKKLMEEAEAEELNLRKKRVKAEHELQGAIEQYDQVLGDRMTVYRELCSQHENEKTSLKDLEDHFQRRDEEAAAIAHEERLWEEKKQAEWGKERGVHDGAVAIQKLARGVLARRDVLAMAKKKKKGGKKKK